MGPGSEMTLGAARRRARHVVVGACMVCLATPGAAADKATIAVLPFEVSHAQSELETAVLVDVFNRVLVNSRKFNVVDRSRLDRVRREQRFSRSSLADAGTRVGIGKILGAQYLVMGTVLDFSVAPPREIAYAGGWVRPVRVSAEVEVIDASTGQIVSARKADGTAQSPVTDPHAAGLVPRDAIERAAEEVATEALIPILNAAYPIKIVDVTGATVRLNRGEGGGLEAGTVLRCFASGRALVDPDTKEALGSGEVAAGSVRITEILAKVSVAAVLDDDGLAVGQACRSDGDTGTEAGTHRAPPPAGPIHSY